jgi:hypothetical protein
LTPCDLSPIIDMNDTKWYAQAILHGWEPSLKKIIFDVKDFCVPPTNPIWSEISVSEVIFKVKTFVELDLKLHKKRKNIQKIRTRFAEDFRYPT